MFVPRSWWILRCWWPNSRPPPDPRGSQGGSPGQQFLPRQVGPVRRETFRRWSDRWRVCSLATGDSGDPDDPRSSRQSLNVGKSTRPGYDVYRASHGFSMALIEIDGLPNLKMVIFHSKLLNNQMVYIYIYMIPIFWRWSPHVSSSKKTAPGELFAAPWHVAAAGKKPCSSSTSERRWKGWCQGLWHIGWNLRTCWTNLWFFFWPPFKGKYHFQFHGFKLLSDFWLVVFRSFW